VAGGVIPICRVIRRAARRALLGAAARALRLSIRLQTSGWRALASADAWLVAGRDIRGGGAAGGLGTRPSGPVDGHGASADGAVDTRMLGFIGAASLASAGMWPMVGN